MMGQILTLLQGSLYRKKFYLFTKFGVIIKLCKMILKSINPFTGNLIGEFREYSGRKIESIITQSEEVFERWKETNFSIRNSLIRQVGRILTEKADLYSAAITAEMGKPVIESKAEVLKCAWVCNYYADNAENFLKQEVIDTDADRSYISCEPLGVILGIMPWNFPFWQVFRFAVPTIIAGNTVLLKHASNVQICASHIEKIFELAGFPQGVFRNLVISSEKVKKVIENELVKGVSLTGSEEAGSIVAAVAGKNIKKSVLELGGNNAFIVLEDAELSKAVSTGLRARLQNAGQSCIAAKRFIVHEKVYDRFVELFLEKLNSVKQGDPMNEETNLGPLVSVHQAEKVVMQVKKSCDMGARIIYGGKQEEAFLQPVLMTDVKPGMPVFDEEVFGPVIPLTIARSTEEAVALANETRYGLGVSLFTQDLAKAADLINKFRDGAVFVNELVKSDPRLPFGGTGFSGYGRELSFHGIREFVNVKTVYIKY
jgi:succinate-semialdehyde dehydrogenase/glutarate-semialdehyde dehydrogenase